ncbi:MAG TPA: 2-C-methyl-D-erythritol 4-phosphate cytidylyltransferase [Deltaproteobacteria bacterium]|nr:2-C-methyl-D-erythritol 4-phosphate cytidylyltransferase [Deltaproteobacteria bacterium]HOM28447.1 2-C-methyl-D-erythritol 4-phosphate cytidylyltransferase [Deltaproteobacteria bacterium]HPP79676.1 2-C-methyl-D-erythritol 4-phosphate cytidylyltransferase [Deltaproteobacteria bacterium]
MPPLDVVIVAGGTGLRYGARKQFLDLGGIPVLRRSAECFERCLPCDRIVVAVPPEDVERASGILQGMAVELIVTPGGATRRESVYNALRHCRPGGTVVVHDGVRPLVAPELARRVVSGLEGCHGCIPALPLTDTVKEAREGFVARTVPRAGLVCVQTPQAFVTDALVEAHQKAHRHKKAAYTDDSSLLEEAGMRVRIVDGDPLNIKITYPADLALAEAILRCRAGSV